MRKIDEVDELTRKALINDLIAGMSVAKVSKKYDVRLPSMLRVSYKCSSCSAENAFNVYTSDTRHLAKYIPCYKCRKTMYLSTTSRVMSEEDWWGLHWGIENE